MTTTELHTAIAQMQVLMTQAADVIERDNSSLNGVIEDASLVARLRAAALPWDKRQKQAARPEKQDLPDLIAGALGVSRGTAYDMMREALAEQPAQLTWVDPNDKTQKQYLPHIGEPVLFCHGVKTYTGKHTGGSFKSDVTNQYFNTWECRWMYLPAARNIKDTP